MVFQLESSSILTIVEQIEDTKIFFTLIFNLLMTTEKLVHNKKTFTWKQNYFLMKCRDFLILLQLMLPSLV